jgi:hypothetical protein
MSSVYKPLEKHYCKIRMNCRYVMTTIFAIIFLLESNLLYISHNIRLFLMKLQFTQNAIEMTFERLKGNFKIYIFN